MFGKLSDFVSALQSRTMICTSKAQDYKLYCQLMLMPSIHVLFNLTPDLVIIIRVFFVGN